MKIVIYTGYQSNPFSPNDLQKIGLGGTEQAIIFLAQALVRIHKHEVYVVGGVIEDDYPAYNHELNGIVKYRTTETFKKEIGNSPIDWLIASSYIHYLKEFSELNFKHSAFWVHNTDFFPWWNGEALPNGGRDLLLDERLTKIICLTKWHKEKFISQFPETKDKIEIIGNGINFSKFYSLSVEDQQSNKTSPLLEKTSRDANIDYRPFSIPYYKKIPNSFIYTSHAERGLSKVLEDWPSIKQELPDATLKIATPSYGLEYFKENYEEQIENLEDVEFFGNLPQKQLYELMRLSEFWYYPSDYEETFCITALEMLANMVKPITYETAGLKETLHGFNLSNFKDEMDLDAAHYWAWRNRWEIVVNKWDKMMKQETLIDFVYVLTIEDNENHIQEKLKNLNIPNEWRFLIKEGFDARNFTPDFYEKYGVSKSTSWKVDWGSDWYQREVTDGEVGCALSHLDAWVDSWADGRELTFILEDDFLVKNPTPWNEVYELIDNGYDLVYLGRYAVNPDLNEKEIENYPKWIEPEYSYNAHSYVLSKRGLRILVEQYFEIYKQDMIPLDEFLSIAIGKTSRTDILEKYKDLPKLKAAAPKDNFILQEGNRGTTEYMIEQPIIENQPPMLPEPLTTNLLEIKNANNWEEWCSKYINPFILKGQYRLMVDEIGPNIIEFPLFTERFCNELVTLAEQYEWVTDRHTYFPTTDQTLEVLGMQEIYQKVLEEFVYPIWIWFWELDGEEWGRLTSENFIAKYDTVNQGSLEIHHDMSQLTLNVRLNDDFKGGGTFIPRYKTTLQPKKIGNAMAHPGQITHKHGGRPVEEGTRYILVSFTNKPNN